MTNKMTKKVALSKAIEALREREGFGEVVTKLEAMLAQVEKEASREKSKGPKALTVEAEKEAFAQRVLAFVKEHEGTGAKAVAEEFGVSFQKVTSALSKLVKAGLVVREEVKGKATFKVA